jgi:hypothetical protein
LLVGLVDAMVAFYVLERALACQWKGIASLSLITWHMISSSNEGKPEREDKKNEKAQDLVDPQKHLLVHSAFHSLHEAYFQLLFTFFLTQLYCRSPFLPFFINARPANLLGLPTCAPSISSSFQGLL